MDLLGDLGAQDQLTSAREENAVLKAKVKELTGRVRVLTVENESLKAEVEMYREEALQSSLGRLNLTSNRDGTASGTTGGSHDGAAKSSQFEEAYVRSGDGIYPNRCHGSIPNLHGASNVLCCSLSPDDTVLATGGVDSTLRLCLWGSAYDVADGSLALSAVNSTATAVPCAAPVTAVAFAPPKSLPRTLASACMDGSVMVVTYGTHRSGSSSTSHLRALSKQPVCQHGKYVRTLVWKAAGGGGFAAPAALLASASADGVVYLHKIEANAQHGFIANDDNDVGGAAAGQAPTMTITRLTSLHLSGAIESMCFVKDNLLCYARGTPHFTVVNVADLTQPPTKLHVNSSPHDMHVSFCVMQANSFQDKYVVAATDANRNFVMDMTSSGGTIVRNFYGHSNDGYSQPKVAWTPSGQYVMGNTTEDGSVVVWDVASAAIVDRLSSHHTQPVRDLFASATSNTLVTTSFDKLTNLWFYDESPSAETIPSIGMARTTDSNDMVD